MLTNYYNNVGKKKEEASQRILTEEIICLCLERGGGAMEG